MLEHPSGSNLVKLLGSLQSTSEFQDISLSKDRLRDILLKMEDVEVQYAGPTTWARMKGQKFSFNFLPVFLYCVQIISLLLFNCSAHFLPNLIMMLSEHARIPWCKEFLSLKFGSFPPEIPEEGGSPGLRYQTTFYDSCTLQR